MTQTVYWRMQLFDKDTWSAGPWTPSRGINVTATAVDEQDDLCLPSEFDVRQNYPNAFNPSTTIRYALPRRSHITLTVYNTLGQKIATLVNPDIEAGYHSVQFDGSELASGVYVYRLTAGSFVQSRKMLVLR